MDPRERTGDAQVAIGAALDGRQAQIWTCLPGIVQSVNLAKMTCSVQPTIQGQFRNQKGDWQNQTMPPCVDCPIQFPGGGGFLMTFPLAAGDEVLIHFSARCIDGWWQSGQVSPQAQIRMHDLSDGFVSPKVYSLAHIPGGVSTTAAQLRTLDGTAHIELAPGGIVNVLAPGGMNVTGSLTVVGGLNFSGESSEMAITGNIALTGSMTASGEVTASGIPLSTHVTTGVTPGGGNSGPPAP